MEHGWGYMEHLIIIGMTTPKKKVYQSSLRFSEHLRQLRSKKRLTLEEVADLAGLGTRYYKQIESRTPNSVTLETIHKLAKAFKITPSKLINFK